MLDSVMSVLAPILDVLFYVGLAGSAIVVLLSFVEDFKTMSGKHE